MCRHSIFTAVAAAVVVAGLGGAGLAQDYTIEKGQAGPGTVPYSPYVEQTFARRVFWGDTHLHTSFSPDAGLVGNFRIGPEEAFRFARGETLIANSGQPVRLSRPLDFLVVSDHSDYLGLIPKIRESDPSLLATEWGKRWHDLFKQGPEGAYEAAVEVIGSIGQGDEKIKDKKIARSAWEHITAAADRYNQPGAFSAFIGFEWTSMPGGGNNLHRVVIFRDGASRANQVLPLTTFETDDPEGLWKYLGEYERKTGGEVLAIPHNGNVSNGLMFDVKTFKGGPLTRNYAESRSRWEPLYEVTQIKGDGEAHPVLSPTDEFADYETWDKGNLLGSAPKERRMLQHEYARSALKLGLQLESKLGVNPFKFGMIGSTDSHTGLATAQEDNFFGKISLLEPKKDRYKHYIIKSEKDEKLTTWGYDMAASGLAAVWARENTREALFDAMRRKETYATTGPRMLVRFFGGWGFKADDAYARDPAAVGYAKGVPMGGDLKQAPKGKAPSFLVGALKDPVGANLDRIQIVKGWLDENGKLHEKIYNVVLSDGRKPGPDGKVPPVGNTVDVAKATYTNSIGDPLLFTVWTDPEFNARQRAFYYARVIEIPTPRWTAYDAKHFGVKMPAHVKMITQDRAYTSPIWYSP